MKKGQFSQEQVIRLLQEAERGEKTVAAVCKEQGITQTTYYRWRRQYGGLDVPNARRLKELESENARLKRLLAERDLAVDALKELLAKNS
jgi:putative transposase